MVGVPWAMAFVEEQQIMEMERTERARDVAGEVCVCLFSFLSLFSRFFLSFLLNTELFSFSTLFGKCTSFFGLGSFVGNFDLWFYGARVWMFFLEGFLFLPNLILSHFDFY